VVAVGLVSLVAGGIYVFQRSDRQPVPWPDAVRVNRQFQLISFPEKVGPFERFDDGEPLGEDIMRTLSIGTTYDRDRYARRRSNWYLSRVYRDTRLAEDDNRYRYWQVQMYYYTGMRDTVPHVPLRCLQAAGNTVLKQENVTFQIPAARSGWDEGVKVRRVHFRTAALRGLPGQEGAEYYVFSLNGHPETRWEKVRLALSYPWVRHCYYAKIQFAPMGGIAGAAEADAATEEFLNVFLPVFLRYLPTAETVEQLDEQTSADRQASVIQPEDTHG